MRNLLPNALVAAGFTLLFALGEWRVTGTLAYRQWSVDFAILFLLTFFRRWKLFLALWIVLEILQLAFYAYFRRFVDTTDIKLFLTHIPETMESFTGLWQLFVWPILMGVLAFAGLFILKRVPCGKWGAERAKKGIFLLLAALIVFNMNSAFQLLGALVNVPFSSSHSALGDTAVPSFHAPLRDADVSIFLVIGESLTCSPLVLKRLRRASFPAHCIVAGATNTDVSVPLLLNGVVDPRRLPEAKRANLFYLAQQNGMETAFISMQSPKALRYITPYLRPGSLQRYVATPRDELPPEYDGKLVGWLSKYSARHLVFAVFQMIGEHSPYIYFPGPKSEDPAKNYEKAVDATVKVLKKMVQVLQKREEPWIFIFTSDHGEFSGEGGRFGHNVFDARIYRVPMFILFNMPLPRESEKIASHQDLYRFIRTWMGYENTFRPSPGPCIVNGTMQNREDGFISVPRD